MVLVCTEISGDIQRAVEVTLRTEGGTANCKINEQIHVTIPPLVLKTWGAWLQGSNACVIPTAAGMHNGLWVSQVTI